MFDKRSFKVLERYLARFEAAHGSGRVDIVLRSSGVDEGVTQTTVINDNTVMIEFGDGILRFVPLEEIVQLVVWEDRESAFGFSVGEPSQVEPTS